MTSTLSTAPGQASPEAPLPVGVLDDDAGLIRTTLARVVALADPLLMDPWGIGPITLADLSTGLPAPVHECRARDRSHGLDLGPWCRLCEVAAVARFFAAGPCVDTPDRFPVTLDVGFGYFVPDWMLVDGNHRVLAAQLRGDEFIDVGVHGDWDRAVAVLVQGTEFDLT